MSVTGRFTTPRYATRRLDTGDYILPSDDLQVLWRICIGEEANERDAGKSVKMWELWRWRSVGRPVDEDVALSIAENHSPWSDYWDCCAFGLRTRTEAIEEAMKLDAARTEQST